ncbi:uncharacterized protein CDAR_270991 [Caerostris darwini]|uniref:Uncharacterized protein n=1 Tax=Caerostris darwini TaxID=1538125 RepID=A0AAV4TBD3_9ARAC|nr:uncharacterized protein CDAR_270991 [Caerostris darwini]
MTKDQEQTQGWNTYLEDVWWPRVRPQQKRRGSRDEAEEELMCHTVPAEYYSRHQMLRTESPNYVMSPTSQNQKGFPVYTYRPGTIVPAQKAWPSRAHDGSMEQKLSSPKKYESNHHPKNEENSK